MINNYINKKELYKKLAEVYNKGLITWGANEIIKDIIGECTNYQLPDSVFSALKEMIEDE